MRQLTVSLGETHNAKITKVLRCTFEEFVKGLLGRVPETDDKASNGWVSGAEFSPRYRHGDNFVARHLISFDYDHIDPADVNDILFTFGGYSYLAYTTWSHAASAPRVRVWLPLSRPCGSDEFEAVSRRVASWFSIEKTAGESHKAAQYMFRPARKPGAAFQTWVETRLPWVDVDAILATYENWTDRKSWPHKKDGDNLHNEGDVASPLEKEGIVGDFCRAFTIEHAIERFNLPYKPGSQSERLTYTLGSRPDGAIIYDNSTKLHSHHDTDPARGQNNAFDLVRLHHFGWLDTDGDRNDLVTRLPSFRAMAAFAAEQPEVRTQQAISEGFTDLDATDVSWLDISEQSDPFGWLSVDGGRVDLLAGVRQNEAAPPERIKKASSRTTDQENARRIQKRFGDKIISVGGEFYFWQGTHWKKNRSSVARCLTHLSAMVQAEAKHGLEELQKKRGLTDDELEAAQEDPASCQKLKPGDIYVLSEAVQLLKWARQCAQSSTQESTKKMLKDLLEFDGERLNTHLHLLPATNGVVDLRTGDLKPHDPGLYLTECAPTPYVASAEAPRFKQFLQEIYAGDQEVIDFMQRWLGYCITGEVREHKMVIHVGEGGNGKGTLFDTISSVLGSFSATAAPGLLLSEDGMSKPSNELADLVGRRMVTVSETDDAAQLREALVKQLTGGDRIKARFLYQEHFEFRPTHKLQMFTNYEPRIRGQDRGMWRRLLLVKYPVRYGSAADVASGKADKVGDIFLNDILAAEAPGILRWLIEGAREWYRAGLRPPTSVTRATDEYQREQDTVAKFVCERCEVSATARVALVGDTESIYQAYRGWTAESGIRPLGRDRFAKEVLRVVPTARQAQWREGEGLISRWIRGFQGLRLGAA